MANELLIGLLKALQGGAQGYQEQEQTNLMNALRQKQMQTAQDNEAWRRQWMTEIQPRLTERRDTRLQNYDVARDTSRYGQQEKMFGLEGALRTNLQQGRFGQQEKMTGINQANTLARMETGHGYDTSMADTRHQNALAEILARVAAQGSGGDSGLGDWGEYLRKMLFQQHGFGEGVDIPQWLGEYNKGMSLFNVTNTGQTSFGAQAGQGPLQGNPFMQAPPAGTTAIPDVTKLTDKQLEELYNSVR